MKHVVNLYNIRWKQKYTQEDIRKATKLSKSSICNLFSGEYHDYRLSTLETICEFFNCDINDILIKIDNKD